MKKVALSFSGGGIKAMVELGIVAALRENDIPIDIIAGMSGGSLVASALTCGKSIEEIKNITHHINFRSFLDLNPLNGLLNREKFYEFLKSYLGDKQIEDCTNPKVIIYATDLMTKAPVVLDSGELASAVLASSAMPLLFKPVEREGRTLIDGGFTIYFGAEYLRKKGADIIIGIDPGGFDTPRLFHPLLDFSEAIVCMFKRVADFEMEVSPVDHIITNFKTEVKPFDLSFVHTDLIDVGYEETMRHMDVIKQLVFS